MPSYIYRSLRHQARNEVGTQVAGQYNWNMVCIKIYNNIVLLSTPSAINPDALVLMTLKIYT